MSYGQTSVSNTQLASFFAGQITRNQNIATTVLAHQVSEVNSDNSTSFGTVFYFADDGSVIQNVTLTANYTSDTAGLIAGILVQPNTYTNNNADLSNQALAVPGTNGYQFITKGACGAIIESGSTRLSGTSAIAATDYGLWANVTTGKLFLGTEADLSTSEYYILTGWQLSEASLQKLTVSTATTEDLTLEVILK